MRTMILAALVVIAGCGERLPGECGERSGTYRVSSFRVDDGDPSECVSFFTDAQRELDAGMTGPGCHTATGGPSTWTTGAVTFSSDARFECDWSTDGGDGECVESVTGSWTGDGARAAGTCAAIYHVSFVRQ